MRFVRFLIVLIGLAELGAISLGSQPAQAQASQYVVGGIALGSRVQFDSAAYRGFRCDPSEQFDGFTWCHKTTREKERRGPFDVSYTMLHSADGRAVYINRNQSPAFWDANEVHEDIERYSRKTGERPRTISMPRRDGFPNGVIALWGNVRLEALDNASRRIVADGLSPKKGILVDFIGDLVRSAREGLPVYRVDGAAGFIWVASYDQRGRGTLRFSAVDASAFMPLVSRPPLPAPASPSAKEAPKAPPRSPEQAIISSGTGFFVSMDGHVLTNDHVIEDCVSVKLDRPGLGTTSARIVARDKSNDLALLRSTEKSNSVPTFRTQLKLGENIFVFGFPLTGLLSSMGNFAVGTVSALAGLRDDSGLVQISASVYPGNSGGPLLDKFGNIVGVIVGRIEKLQNVNFAIKSGIALNFLASNRVNPQEGAMVTELRSEEIADRANSFTVRVLCSSNASSAQETDQALPEKATTSLPSRLQFDHYVSDLDPNGWNWLALRNGPSTSAQWSKTVQVGPDTPVKILDQSGEFSRIQLRSGEMGWVTSKYLACCRDDGEDPTYHFVTNLCLTCEDGWLALRRDPSPEGPFSQQPKLKSGAVLSVIRRSQGYYKVRLRTGETGWVTSDHVGCCR